MVLTDSLSGDCTLHLDPIYCSKVGFDGMSGASLKGALVSIYGYNSAEALEVTLLNV